MTSLFDNIEIEEQKQPEYKSDIWKYIEELDDRLLEMTKINDIAERKKVD